MKRTLEFRSDPGHGWLKVKQADLIELGIAHKISGCSYMRGEYAYLEEDCDASVYLKAAKEKNWDISIKSTNSNNTSRIRNYASYSSSYVGFSVEVGQKFYGYKLNGPDDHSRYNYILTDTYTCVDVDEKSVVMKNQNGSRERCPINWVPQQYLNEKGRLKLVEKEQAYRKLLRNLYEYFGDIGFKFLDFDPDNNSFGIYFTNTKSGRAILKGDLSCRNLLINFGGSNMKNQPFDPLTELGLVINSDLYVDAYKAGDIEKMAKISNSRARLAS